MTPSISITSCFVHLISFINNETMERIERPAPDLY
ncbi:hypothetical protein EVA_19888 [gut metagenome]|uniref:Uncharacterized protein n=1 Tax=gut metagenome TaxID=749906 RepID=J9FAS2_9ZZZZ